MSHVTNGREGTKRAWKILFQPIAAELAAAEAVLRDELQSRDPFVDGLVKHAIRLGGKRLRPALLLLTAKAVSAIEREHIVLAAVVEMIHAATLVHDDVLDEATLRRHKETVNARSDNEASVLLGDFLFTHAFSLASSLETTFACQTIGRATNVVCAGELRQINSRGNFALSEAEYLDIIEAKTAELCACCCRLGAHYAGATPEVEESMDRYGRALGIAFQIADDLLDLVGEESTVGKSLGTDLEKQKPTLPLIRLLASSSEPLRRELIELFQDSSHAKRQALQERIRDSEAMEYAFLRAQWHAQQAEEELQCLPPSPARDVLTLLTKAAVARRE